jgi:hypothetical protein
MLAGRFASLLIVVSLPPPMQRKQLMVLSPRLVVSRITESLCVSLRVSLVLFIRGYCSVLLKTIF